MKLITGSKGYYITDDGIVLRKLSKSNGYNQLKPALNPYGYLQVALSYTDGTRHTVLIHRLIALAFIPNPSDYPVVDHIDEDKLNNSISNLRWCTHQMNTEYYRTKDGRDHHTLLRQTHKQKLRTLITEARLVLREIDSKASELDNRMRMHNDRVARFDTYMEGEYSKIATLNKHANRFSPDNHKPHAVSCAVKVNDISFASAYSAAKYIYDDYSGSGSQSTIYKEIRKFLNGKRRAWSYYGKYAISS